MENRFHEQMGLQIYHLCGNYIYVVCLVFYNVDPEWLIEKSVVKYFL